MLTRWIICIHIMYIIISNIWSKHKWNGSGETSSRKVQQCFINACRHTFQELSVYRIQKQNMTDLLGMRNIWMWVRKIFIEGFKCSIAYKDCWEYYVVNSSMNTAHAIGVRLLVLGPAVTSQTHLAQYYLKKKFKWWRWYTHTHLRIISFFWISLQ